MKHFRSSKNNKINDNLAEILWSEKKHYKQCINLEEIENKIERRIKEENNTLKIDDKQNKIMRLVLKML